ncbi:MAG: desulfoferrodoxin FeS4 iron-binding domain-containing protein [bacterium]|nr:desulfoferrodoxin FeS4 iron-binding domain-containing protein [bacterium]
MSTRLGIYKCKYCGNVVQTLISGDGDLVCCGKEMELLEEQYEENELGEKHVPETFTMHEGCDTGTCREVKYVSVLKHPMIEEHYIQFIEAINKDKNEVRIKFFNPNDRAEYNITDLGENVHALELCNIHNLWRSKND